MDLTPDFLLKMRNYRAQGTVAKVNLALSALPSFAGVTDAATLTGRIHIGPISTISSAHSTTQAR